MFSFLVNNEVIANVENTVPLELPNVQIFAGDNYYEAPETGKIKNLIIINHFP